MTAARRQVGRVLEHDHAVERPVHAPVLADLVTDVDHPVAVQQRLDVLPPGAVDHEKRPDRIAAGRLEPDLAADVARAQQRDRADAFRARVDVPAFSR